MVRANIGVIKLSTRGILFNNTHIHAQLMKYGNIVKLHVRVLAIDISASHSSCILIGQLLNESHQKVVKKMSKINQKLIKNFVEWQR